MKLHLFVCWAFLPFLLNAQSLERYQAQSNPQYWKHRMPEPGYWQQDVHYSIRARLDDQTDIVSGSEILTYQNNSPDTLYEVFFHLYQNAFQPGSYMSELMHRGNIEVSYGQYEAQKLGTEIMEVRQDDQIVKAEFDNTIMKLVLLKPINPGQRTEFFIAFKTYFDRGSLRRRMKLFDHDGVKHYDGVHWYPRVCVYDRKFGWTTDQHLGKEFYGEYGVYDVELQFPSPYILEATGVLMNEKEVLPDELRKKLDISNFKTFNGVLSKPIPSDGTYKAWRYHAENVHDFAFTADPTYRIAEVVWNGIRCIALAQEPNAPGWQNTAQFVADVIKTYSLDFGMYAYPKMVAADARDGMEYPMITLNSGNWPGHKYVIAHEVGHNWFYGMVGNNETYSAGMDEGFTQFLTSWSLKKTSGNTSLPNNLDQGVVYDGYLNHAVRENTARLNIHSDHFGSAERHGGGYGQVYYKTASMLYNLQYVLGDALFEDAMKHYFNQWKFAHPYWEDFRNSIIQYTGVDLNWFFDQWLTTTKTIDYSIENIKRIGKTNAGYVYEITLRRKGEMQMPIDLTVIDKNGSTYNYHIPNLWYVKEGAHLVSPAWRGWDLLYPTYTLKVELNAPLKDAQIDPTGRMSDIYRLDNKLKNKQIWKPDFYKHRSGGIEKYLMMYGLNNWYNSLDGIKIGISLQGDYYKYRHLFQANLWYNSGIAAETNGNREMMSYRVSYSDKLGYRSSFTLSSSRVDGVETQSAGFLKYIGTKTLTVNFKSLRIREEAYLFPIPDLAEESGKWNNSVNAEMKFPYKRKKGEGNIQIEGRLSAFSADFNYSWIGGEWNQNRRLGRTVFKSRLFGRIYGGNGIPVMSGLYLGGASPEQAFESKFTRSVGVIPADWGKFERNSGPLHIPGGLNLRGYSMYLASNTMSEDTGYTYRGNAGTSINAEWDFTGLIPLKMPKLASVCRLNLYVFGDAGILWNAELNSGLRSDAGLGTLWTFQLPGRPRIQPLEIRADFPVFMNRVPDAEEYLAFRWLLGIRKSF